MSFVIVNPEPYTSAPAGQWFVTRPESERSYTRMLQKARLFATREEAAREKCDNEYIIPTEEAFG